MDCALNTSVVERLNRETPAARLILLNNQYSALSNMRYVLQHASIDQGHGKPLQRYRSH